MMKMILASLVLGAVGLVVGCGSAEPVTDGEEISEGSEALSLCACTFAREPGLCASLSAGCKTGTCVFNPAGNPFCAYVPK